MINILYYLIVAIMCILGVGSVVAIVGYMFVIIIQKFYRKLRYGNSLFDLETCYIAYFSVIKIL